MSRRISIVASFIAVALAGCASTSVPIAAAERVRADVSERTPRVVHGDLDIANQDSLEAFADLEVVTGTLTIVGNTRLKDLDGLNRLRAVGHLVITENLALRNIEALSGLRNARSVTVTGNPRLENLRGLESLSKLDRLVVTENGIFLTAGIDGLVVVGDLIVSRNPRLLSLRGFSHLESATNITIARNPRIAARNGLLADLRRVHGKLRIERNAGIQRNELEALEKRLNRRFDVVSR